MYKRKFAIMLLLVIFTLLSTSSLVMGQAGVGEVIGDATGVPYVVKESINNGEPITISLWDWWTPRFNYWKEIAPKYTELYPNVTFDIVQSPGAEYWTKLAAAIPAGQGPDILAFHNEQRAQYIGNNLVDPYPPELFDVDYLKENWLGFEQNQFQDAEGNVRYLPYGPMAALLFINTDLWEAAGLTDADIPTTWDEVLEVSKKLTQTNDQGLIDVAGFSFNTATTSLWNDLQYQLGSYMYGADGKSCDINSPADLQALDTITRFYDEGVTSRDFPGSIEAFGGGQIAMTYHWTWYSAYLGVNFPELNFKTALLPTFTGEASPAIGRNNPDVSSVIPATTAPERKAVAWDFLHWLYSQDDVLIDLALIHSVAPSYTKLFDNPRILENPAIHLLTERLEYTVFPGDFPPTVDNALFQNIDGIVMAGGSNQEALDAAQEACNAAMQEQDYWTTERTYGHADLMLPD